jgi:acyl-CoA synthetase (NDP forming)
MTALMAGWALALYAVVAVVTGTTRTTLEGYRFGTVAVAGALAVFAATVRSRREGALITISERVQHAILHLLPAEATTEKVVHQLVVHDGTTAEQRAAA